MQLISNHWLGGRQWQQLASCNGVRKSANLVGTIAERLVGRMAAAAEAHLGTPGKAEWAPLGIDDFEVSFDTKGTVVIHGYFCRRHHFLQGERERISVGRAP